MVPIIFMFFKLSKLSYSHSQKGCPDEKTTNNTTIKSCDSYYVFNFCTRNCELIPAPLHSVLTMPCTFASQIEIPREEIEYIYIYIYIMNHVTLL